MTVCELVDRYLKTKTGVRQSTKQGYVTVQRLLAKESFWKKTIRSVKTSDAKLFLIKLQQEDGKSYSSIHTIRGVLRPAFQMVVDDDILVKNPFGFQLAGVLVNDAVTREAISKDQMRKFLKFIHDDVVYCKYYEVVYILFHTGMRISEFCGLTLKDIDLQNRTVNIDHRLQRTSDMRCISQKPQRRMQEQECCRLQRMWHKCFRRSLRTEMHRKWRSPQMDIVDSYFTMIMECHLWQCTGSTDSIIWLADTMTFTGCRCQTLHLMVEL